MLGITVVCAVVILHAIFFGSRYERRAAVYLVVVPTAVVAAVILALVTALH